MSDDKTTNPLDADLRMLGLSFMAEQHGQLAAKAARDSVSHVDYLSRLTEGELNQRRDKATVRRIKNARFPVLKTLDQFSWSWPKKINRMAVQNLFRLQFMEDHSNVIMLGTVGLGKTHLATALGYPNAQHTGLAGAADWLGRLLSSAFVNCPLVPAR
jgi:DNA replication protein DnaC